MTANFEQLKTTLRRHGYSLTAPRAKVFAALEGQEPRSMHELLQAVSDIDRASAYRTVDLFIRLGIIERLQFGWKYKLELSDAYAPHHHHLTCTICHIVRVLDEHTTLEKLIQTLARKAGYVPSSHQIEIRGICQRCQKNDPGKPGIGGSLTLPPSS